MSDEQTDASRGSRHGMRELARRVEERCSRRLGECFDVERLDGRGRQLQSSHAVDIVLVPRGDRFETVAVGESSGCDTSDSGGRWRLTRSSSEDGIVEARAVLESRIFAVAAGLGGAEGSVGLETVPFPKPATPVARQLRALRRRQQADRRGVDRAVERVVAELYGLDLPELVALQASETMP